jgi:hypothetical protein
MGFLERLFSWTPSDAPASRQIGPLQAYSTYDLAQDVGFPDFMRGGLNSGRRAGESPQCDAEHVCSA